MMELSYLIFSSVDRFQIAQILGREARQLTYWFKLDNEPENSKIEQQIQMLTSIPEKLFVAFC